MSVTPNAIGTPQNNNGVQASSFTYTGMTVAAGSQTGLLATVQIDGGASTATSPTAVWDSGGTNQAMTLVASVSRTTGQLTCIFALRNPIAGNKNLALSWTNNNSVGVEAVAFNGVEQFSDATAFKNSNSASGSSASAAVTITSAVGDIVVSACSLASSAVLSVNGTLLVNNTNMSSDNQGAQYNAGAASVASTYTLNASGGWSAVGIDVAASAVQVDATGTPSIAGGAGLTSPQNYTGITVGTGLSNSLLLFFIYIGTNGNHSGDTFTATWDNGGTNQAMTQVGSTLTSGTAPLNELGVVVFALLAPTAGNKTLRYTWSGVTDFPTVEAISLTGVEQSSIAAACKNIVTNTSLVSSPTSVTVSSAINDMVIGLYGTASFAGINQTLIFSDGTTASGPDSAACRAAGASTVTVTGTPISSAAQAVIGFNVAAFGSGPILIAPQQNLLRPGLRGLLRSDGTRLASALPTNPADILYPQIWY